MTPTRRTIITGLAALPLAACPAAAPAASADPTWDRLRKAYDAARGEMLARMAVFNEREKTFLAAGGFPEPQPCKPKLTEEGLRVLAVECLEKVNPTQWEGQMAAYRAEMDAWSERRKAAEAEIIGDAENAMIAAESAETDAFNAMRDHPAPDLPALAYKAEAMAERYGEMLEASEALALIGDIRRLAGGEA